MTDKIQLSGLCINCLNAEECHYRVNHIRPVIFCEEFSCTKPSDLKNNITRVTPKIENPLNSLARGICSNCDNIEICNLQNPDDSIINCEEYR